MGRSRSSPKSKTKPPAAIGPFDNEEDDEEVSGGGIPDEDGWIHLREKKEPEREDKKPKRRSARRSS
jgi:hypothetical protein